MIPVTVSGTSIIVLRTATSMWASAPVFPLRCATTSWLGSCHAQAESSPCGRPGADPGPGHGPPRRRLGHLFQVILRAERVAQLVRINRHHRMWADAGHDPARDEALPLPVALLPDPVSREVPLKAEQHICHEGSTPPPVRAPARILAVSLTIRPCESLRIDDARALPEGYRQVVTNPQRGGKAAAQQCDTDDLARAQRKMTTGRLPIELRQW